MHNFKQVFLGIAILLLHGLLSAQSQFDSGLLWEISGKELRQPSYVFGTLHMICPEDFVVFDGVEQSLEKSKRLVLELDLSDPYIMMGVQMAMFMDEGNELKDLLSARDYKMVSNFFADSLGMEVGFISRIKPFFLMSLLYPHMLDCQPKSYEQYFMQYATDNSMIILGLETLQEQLDVFDALSYEQQAEMLTEIIRDYPLKREEFASLVKLYLSADLIGMLKMFDETQTQHPDFNQRLLNDRNHRWIERIENLMHEDTSFIAVGAGHLPGEEGILYLLEKEGYSVKLVE